MKIANLAARLTGIDASGLQRRVAIGAMRLPSVVAAAGLLAVYVGLEWVSFIHEHKGLPVTPWNPGLGVAFAALVLWGPAYAVVLFAGVVIAETLVLRSELAWPVIVAMAAIVAASFATAAALARSKLQLDVGLRNVRDVLVLLAAGAAAATVSAALLTLLLLGADELTRGDLMQASVPLLVGDAIGVAVMTPICLRLSRLWPDLLPDDLRPLLIEVLVHVLAVGAALWLIVNAERADSYKYFSLLFLPVVAAALRHGLDGSCVSLAATQLGLVAVLAQYGYDAAAFTEFQVEMLVLTMSGLLVGVVVSERRRAEAVAREAEVRLQGMQAEATRAARLNMVSGMASALAHEINQPMTAARALARSAQLLLRAETKDLPRADANLTNLIAQVDHAGGVVRRMRDFLRRGRPHFSTLDIKAVLDDALVLARPEAAAKRAAIDLDVGPIVPAVFGDRVQLQQVVLNLVHNALESIVEAKHANGRVRVAAHVSKDQPAIEISVADNGVGILDGRPLFEPLSSSKKEGLGLGLSICAGIVQAHGGRIWLQSGSAGATEFRFTLPVQEQGPS